MASSPTRRINVVARHLSLGGPLKDRPPGADVMENVARSVEDRSTADLTLLLPGPMDDAQLATVADLRERKVRVMMNNMARYTQHGLAGTLAHEQIAAAYAGTPFGQNFVIPFVFSPHRAQPYLDWMVILANNEDCARIARTHVQKSDAYGFLFLGNGVLSTTDNPLWRAQRQHLVEAFLPEASLAHVFPVSLRRARFATETRLRELTNDFTKPVEINEFWLHEAMAQLQLALLGETEAWMDRTNIPLRRAFAAANAQSVDLATMVARRRKAQKFIRGYASELVERATGPAPARAPRHAGACPAGGVRGPVTARLADLDAHMAGLNVDADQARKKNMARDTAATFLFAGHDTTANLMTWATFELARRPELQARAHAEVDAAFAKLAREGGAGGRSRDMAYGDLAPMFPFLARVLTETLRMWPSVPSGTFRQLQYDDVIVGRGGQRVTLPKGTQCAISVWMLHQNPDLWKDPERFDPDRAWLPGEIVGRVGLNPQSHRFCPFTFEPRSCMGRNFALMEARVLLAHFFRRYDVALAEPTRSAAPAARRRVTGEPWIATNYGTLAPAQGMHVRLTPRGVAATD